MKFKWVYSITLEQVIMDSMMSTWYLVDPIDKKYDT